MICRTRDNLTINMAMLIHPLDFIEAWQWN